MKQLLIGVGLMVALVLPATAGAATKADKREAKRECRQLQKAAGTRANFVQIVKLEARANRRNAFGRCVKVRTADAAKERNAAFKAAKAACESLRPGQGKKPPLYNNPPGAYGRCVAAAAKAHLGRSDATQRADSLNPARECRDMQKNQASAYNTAYPGKNGFGKCVSAKAKD